MAVLTGRPFGGNFVLTEDHHRRRPPKGPTEQDDLCGYQHLDAEH
jgi:hypothetical protein